MSLLLIYIVIVLCVLACLFAWSLCRIAALSDQDIPGMGDLNKPSYPYEVREVKSDEFNKLSDWIPKYEPMRYSPGTTFTTLETSTSKRYNKKLRRQYIPRYIRK